MRRRLLLALAILLTLLIASADALRRQLRPPDPARPRTLAVVSVEGWPWTCPVCGTRNVIRAEGPDPKLPEVVRCRACGTVFTPIR